MTSRRAIGVAGIVLVLATCGDGSDSSPTTIAPAPATATGDTAVKTSAAEEQRFPDVVGVDATYDDAAATWTFAVTISSPYDTPDRYADGWRVVGQDGTVYGVHTLAHDHAGEQPFTRRQSGVEIPADVDEVTIEGRDQEYGFGGRILTIPLQTG
jgi:hypothetical protein